MSSYFQMGSYRMHYTDEGKGPVLVFVHGNPTWSYYWRELLLALKNKYRVIAMDHIGCGLSDKPQDYLYTLETHIQNTTSLLNHLGVKDITLVVHDWGGAIGMGYATRNPEKISRFIVFNTAAFTSQRMPLRLSLCRIPFLGKAMIQGLNSFAWGATYLATTKGFDMETRTQYLKPYDSYKNRIATYQFVKDIPLSPRHPSWKTLNEIEKGLSKFKDHPMTILWGGKDWVFTRHFLTEWRSRFPDAESHLFEDAGHYVVEDAKDKVIPLVKDFLKRTDHALQH